MEMAANINCTDFRFEEYNSGGDFWGGRSQKTTCFAACRSWNRMLVRVWEETGCFFITRRGAAADLMG